MKATELIDAIDGARAPTRSIVADQLRTPGECAEALGVSSSTFLWWTKNAADFPSPFKDYEGKRGYRPLYWWNDVSAWYSRRNRKAENGTD